MIRLFLKRVLENKLYWIAVAAAFLLLLCSMVYTDPMSGKSYTFLSLYYKEEMRDVLAYGGVTVREIMLGSGSNYLWMFAPIITGIPCILTQKTERFVLFRSNKNRYFFSKYVSNLIAGGLVLVGAYILFAIAGMVLLFCLQVSSTEIQNLLLSQRVENYVQQLSQEIWHLDFCKQLLSIFVWGMLNAVWGILLSEYIKNKYLILCIPFVWNYFLSHFLQTFLPWTIYSYLSILGYSWLFLQDTKTIIIKILLLFLILIGCGGLMKFTVERRCDCGQK